MADNSTILQEEQTSKVLTNNLLLRDSFDNSGALMAIKFGGDIQESDGEDANFTLRFKATEAQGNFAIDRHLLNFVCTADDSGAVPAITFNDYKIWNETNDGPNSGLNADLLDGRHATEFKDRYGYHHFLHQVNKDPKTTDEKNWVKIATFTTRRIMGNRSDLDYTHEGKPAYGGVFEYSGNGVFGVDPKDVVVPGGNVTIPAKNINSLNQALATLDIRDQFKANTPQFLDEYDPDVFHTTNLLTEGVYNGALRGCVTLLKNDNATTFDFHVGLFEDPLYTKDTTMNDAWNGIRKYFYVSLHDETLPFLSEKDVYTTPSYEDMDSNLNKGYTKDDKRNWDTDDENGDKDASGAVIDGYSASYPNFPQYSWSYSGNTGTKNYQNDVTNELSGGTKSAMANLYFTKPDVEKAKRLRELKLAYGNDYKLALESELARLKELGLAMADGDSDPSGGSGPGGSSSSDGEGGKSSDKDSSNANFNFTELSQLDPLIEQGSERRHDFKDDPIPHLEYRDEDVEAITDVHTGPLSRIDLETKIRGNYQELPKTIQEAEPYNETKRMRKPFPKNNDADQGDKYQTYIDIMRLYHVNTIVEPLDGLQVVTHIFELYMAIDEKTEIRIQPYMSSACLMYNFNECVPTGEMPAATRYIRPKSIYDNRYASVRHRHYDYERRIWELTLEADQIWKNFKNYVAIDQGMDNANKVMLTDKEGKVYAADDNMVRHCEPTDINPDTGEAPRRKGSRVLVTGVPENRTIENCKSSIGTSCVEESGITITELNSLKGIRGNIQDQINDLLAAVNDEVEKIWTDIGDVWEVLKKIKGLLEDLVKALNAALGNFVKKTGDTMNGSLWIQYDGKALKNGAPKGFEEKNKDGGGETFCGVKFYSTASDAKHGGYLYGATNKTSVGLGVQRKNGEDRDADWAIALIAEEKVDGKYLPLRCNFNFNRITFAIDGRDDTKLDANGKEIPANTFSIDFKKLYDWYNSTHTETLD
ncbi:hypothetical protein B0P06_006083 [Clostridium saccharoperbutylacetonicum]|uniref:Uncharacterized protein n=1 Tax=Clostridium saccharoperbutylacetonicum N1-4(HMT) TaxID=931276 RepID=M1N8I7_9CLOT|nr:hypothetical protein [Clostridium saccharoperbutylacetonicum]AGF59642.1 hypothetical protein Cspa_135p00820 [Clostridium saccharoperbutylacetonicum N1-4(HMT)]NRT64501.1 hypothetical protein [Clostridium saccharoperbutylacetonicum]NSB28976.1 hypothetical protein [Clostridium saccharoperbutylacetonicum]NSB46190.1 hypothetical protein [Clostridium saccharoperbutylacetonicum]